jgi:hypothetical protein
MQCLENHTCSGVQPGSRLPHRVLDLQAASGSQISLYESEDQEGTYACLSHIWGVSQPLKTTKSSLGAMKSGILAAALPKTFLDAVTIVRFLNIRFLWVDSLCIIQDDHRDWQREAAKMAEIYQNCLVTVAATGSDDANSGLFYNDPNIADENLAAFSKNPDHKGIFISSLDGAARHGFDGKSKLLTRGWVLQERLLSPRLLHFKHELIFECREDRVCECSNLRSLRWPPAIASKVNGDELKLMTMSSEALCSSWHNIVRDYAKLQLTYDSDVLPAISGLAQLYRRYLGGGYVAGMWATSLASCLTWHVNGGRHWMRRTSWVAPTFSWACNKFELGPDLSASDISVLWASDSVNREYEILDLSQTLTGSDLTGQITQAHLILKGLLYPVRLKYDLDVWRSGYGSGLIATYAPLQALATKGTNQFFQDFNYTALNQSQHNRTLGTQAYCFLLCSEHATDHSLKDTTYLLVLKKTCDREGTAGEYERIGMIKYKDEHGTRWNDGTMEQSWADELRNLAGGESGIVKDAIIRLV